jgi:cell fate regulator YaaT (PSP1 superfamily)
MRAPTGDESGACLSEIAEQVEEQMPEWIALVRYGRVPQVARFGGNALRPDRDALVVVSTERGEELGAVLHVSAGPKTLVENEPGLTGQVQRLATDADSLRVAEQQQVLDDEFGTWMKRAAAWKLQLEIIDLEKTLDGRLILYVLNDRGPETTRLALLAAAAGYGVVHVQPVAAEGIVQEKSGGGGGCGDCGCSTH